MLYKVTKQFLQGPETILNSFKNVNEAESFVKTKLAEDARFNLKTTYRIYEFDDVVKEFTQDSQVSGAQQAAQAASQSGQSGKTQSFSPTPFNMKPQPGGLPHSWIKDVDAKDEDKKE